mgnify:CR=1 FL=1
MLCLPLQADPIYFDDCIYFERLAILAAQLAKASALPMTTSHAFNWTGMVGATDVDLSLIHI